VNRALLPTRGFERALQRCSAKNPLVERSIRAALERLANNAFDPRLKTHKLKGDLAGRWAASAGYDLRIIFRLVQHDGREAILLLSVGTHDDVY
jgi:mRNA-degrading endonuclease YafQ of YafQ-DinJ toxin-antitoxin module